MYVFGDVTKEEDVLNQAETVRSPFTCVQSSEWDCDYLNVKPGLDINSQRQERVLTSSDSPVVAEKLVILFRVKRQCCQKPIHNRLSCLSVSHSWSVTPCPFAR